MAVKFTSMQRKALSQVRFAKIVYKDKFEDDSGSIAYTINNKFAYYTIVISNSLPRDAKLIILLHEVGHIYFNHMELNFKEELATIVDLFKKHNKPIAALALLGGINRFINICTDFEVNSKLFTIGNINTLEKDIPGFHGCYIEDYNIPYGDSFRDYYEPLIKLLPDANNSGSKGSSGSNSSNQGDQQGNQGSCKLPNLGKELSDLLGSAKPSDTTNSDLAVQIMKDNYKDPSKSNSAVKESNSIDPQKDTVEDEVKKETSKTDQENKGSRGDIDSFEGMYSNHHRAGNPVVIKDDIDQETVTKISSFLKEIIRTSDSYKLDSIKLYNRGTRRNSNGILYTSVASTHKKTNKKLGIVIDVSGSMNTKEIIRALATLKKCFRGLSSESKVVTWDTAKLEEFPITKIPSKVNSGGGTNMEAAYSYFKNQRFNDVVIYSDFQTNLSDLCEALVPQTKLHMIIVNGNVSNNPLTEISNYRYDREDVKKYSNLLLKERHIII